MDIIVKLTEEFGVKKVQIEQAVKLIDEGNTVPFIARYRKDVTGGLNDEQLRAIDERLRYLRGLEERKQEVLRSIEEQGKLTDELKVEIERAEILQRVEDLYKPFKQKKTTRAGKAKAKGLEPLALIIYMQQNKSGDVLKLAEHFVDPEKEVETAKTTSSENPASLKSFTVTSVSSITSCNNATILSFSPDNLFDTVSGCLK